MGKSLLLLLSALCIGIVSSTYVNGQAVAKPSHTEAIPKDHYKTWSLFLICNPRWMADDKTQDLSKLHRAFQAFGETIGKDNLAVWFWIHRYQGSKTTLDDVDLERSSAFCEAYGLLPSGGPYIVVTSTYPDDSRQIGKLPPNSAWFELAAMTPSEISDLLAHLADQLVAKKMPSREDSTARSSEAELSWDVRLLGAAQQLLNRLGCAWTFRIDAEGMKAELQSCTR
jgi:hypothetical protein